MDHGKVFISSVLNTEVEDLREERAALKVVVEAFPFLQAWAFEHAPASIEDLDQSYLRHVEECDLFAVILGAKISEPVIAEIQHAKKFKKPMLVFAKRVTNRLPTADMTLDSLGRKYASFETIDELRQSARTAIESTLILGLRNYRPIKAESSTLEQLADYPGTNLMLRVSPIVPGSYDVDLYTVREVSSARVLLKKSSNSQDISVPSSRITEILYGTDDTEPKTLMVNGRIQLVTAQQRWKFFPEHVDPGSIGLGKLSAPNLPGIIAIRQRIGAMGFSQFTWDWISNISDRLRENWEVFYDDDGKYLRYVTPPSEQIFFVGR